MTLPSKMNICAISVTQLTSTESKIEKSEGALEITQITEYDISDDRKSAYQSINVLIILSTNAPPDQ